MARIVSAVELLAGSLLVLAALVLFANAQLCWFNQHSCGMVEPILAVYALAVAIPLLVAGVCHWKRKMIAGALACLPAMAVVLALVGQARQWW